MKTIRLYILSVISLLFLFQMNAFGQVNVSIQILPPYPTKFTDYASKPQQVLITVTNTSTTTQRIQLRGSVTGDNGVSIRSKMSYKSTTAIELGAGQARNLNGNDIAYFFDYTNLQYTGITQSQFINIGGLPEGSYQFCLRAYNYDTNEPLSAEEPAGCSNTFSISSLEPPTILSPMSEQTIQSGPGQVFSIRWSTPVGTPPGIQYRIRMVEILGNKNPNDAIMTATQPYFFEKEVMTNMYVYSPADPQLTPGRNYALMVEAFDPFNTVAFRNKGKSEVIMFTYGKNDYIPQDVVVVKKDSLAKRTTVITGNLKYRFNDASESGVFALSNTKVYLEKVYVNITTDSLNGTTYKPINGFISAKIPFLTDPMDGVIAQTDKNGNFEMKVGLTVLDSAGLLTNYHKDLLGINQVKSSSRNMASFNTATIGVMYRLKISNPHFKDYSELLRIIPGDTINLQQKVVDANSYQLNLNVAAAFNGLKGKFVSNAKVRIYRLKTDKTNRQLSIPLFEGNLLDSAKNWKEYGDKVLIAEAFTPSPDSLVSNNQANPKPFTVTFKRLFRNIAQEGYHYLISLEDGEKVIIQKSFDELSGYKSSVKSLASKSVTNNPGKQTWTDFAYNQPLDTAYLTLLKEETASPRSKVTGTLKYAFKYYAGIPNQPYANMPVSLRSSSDLKSVLATTVTDEKGRFVFDFANVDSIYNDTFSIAGRGTIVTPDRVYHVVPEVKYYAIPDNKIVVQPWASYDCGELLSLVQTYSLKVNAQGEGYREGSYGKVGIAGSKIPDVPTVYDNMSQAEVLVLRYSPDAYKSQIPNLVGMNTTKEVIFDGANASTNNYRAAGALPNNMGNTVYQANLVNGETESRGNKFTLLRTLYTEANGSTVTIKGLIPSIDINKDNYQIRVGSADRVSNSVAYETSMFDYPYHLIKKVIELPQIKKELNVAEMIQREKDMVTNPDYGYRGMDPGGAMINSGITAKDMTNVNQGLIKAAGGLKVAVPKAMGAGKVGLSFNNFVGNVNDQSWKKLGDYLKQQPIYTTTTVQKKKSDINTVGPVITSTDLIFNSQLPAQEPAYEELTKVYKKEWRIAGRVVDGASKLGVSNVSIGISYKETTGLHKGTTYFEKSIFSNDNGDFVITAADLSKPAVYYNDKDIQVSIYKSGYEAIYKQIGIMTKGKQVYEPQIILEPSAKGMYGYVVEKGDVARPVVARVKMLDNGVWVNTELNVYNGSSLGNRPDIKAVQQFKMDLPNSRVKLMIMPYDRAYITREVEVQVDKNNKFLGTFELAKRVHKINITVSLRNSKDLLVPAVVTLVENGLKDTINVGTSGPTAYFEFVNNATKNYTFHVKPLNTNLVAGRRMFVPTTLTIPDEDDGTAKNHDLYVSPGKAITGNVTFDDGKAVASAKVFLETGSGAATENFTRTDDNGNYILVLPLAGSNQYNIRASYFEEEQTYISGEKSIDSLGTVANLIIKKVNNIDVSKLFGFKALVSTLIDEGNGIYTVSGELYDLPTNKNFGLGENVLNRNLSFNAVKIKLSGLKNKNNVPIAVPVENNMPTDNRELAIKVNNSFNGIMHGETDKITLTKTTSDTTGTIKAKVRILDNSFEFPSSYMRMESTDFYLGVQNGAEAMPVFSSAQNIQPIDKFLLTNTQGQPIAFRYLGFKGVADIEGARASNLKGEKISLFLNLSTILPGKIPLTLKAGMAEISKGGIGKIINTDTISFKLENWTVKTMTSTAGGNSSTWELSPSSGGLVLKKGEILTGKLNIPFTNMKILPSEESFAGDLVCSDIKSTGAVFTVGGIAKLRTKNGAQSMFIYDPGVGRDGAGHYKVSVTAANYNDYAASFSGLDGMTNPKDEFKIQIISMLSNSEELFSFVNNQSITYYNQIKFTPQTLSTTSQNSLSIAGTFDLGIPSLNSRFFENLLYVKNGIKNKVTMPVFNFSFLGKGGVKFTSSTKKESQIINAKGFVIAGNMELPGGVRINGGKLISMVSKGGQSLIDASGEIAGLLPPGVAGDIERQIDVVFGGRENIEKYFDDVKDNLEASIKAAKDELLNQAEEAVKNEVTKLIPMGTDVAKGALGELAGVWKLGDQTLKQGQAVAQAIKEGNYMKLAGMMRNIPGINTAIEDLKNKVQLEAMNALTAAQDKLPDLQDVPVTGDGFEPGKFEFDLKNGRVFGNISFKAITLGAVGLRNGGMEMLFSRDGWYFAAGATMDIPVPILTPLKVGILLGSYGPIPPEVETRVTQMAQSVSGKLPDAVRNGLSGFFIVGGKTIVDVDVAFGIPAIAEIKLVASAGAEVRNYALFGKGKFTMGFGALVYGRVFSSASLLGVTASGGAELNAAVAAKFVFANGNAAACVQGCLSVNFSVEICAPIAGCASKEASVRAMIKAGIGNQSLMRSDTKCTNQGFDFSIDTGTASCINSPDFDF
ncbi:hypothetical protein EZ428_18730 [Pedobacter frigiditerrae]|uniref:TANFOR domain-containing protein n=1 Tax=Pedobacter frigiditerrae TaxID=2530452 RepID=A0A4R0MRL1_9SPHI|nr:carboxypeptidase-like regulatory domain-containing protein [Pedobacter frigiditerrae]TCC88674.1 hypothetical protein EZ428_18730 [Pedobacter frigiditerrae]